MRRFIHALRRFYYAARYGEWDFSIGYWEGKPNFSITYIYYDGDWYALHLGPIAIGLHY